MGINIKKITYICTPNYENHETEKAKNLAKDFANFYSSVYRVNDFSLSSVSSANTEETKKEILSKGLLKFQSLLNDNSTAKNKKKQ